VWSRAGMDVLEKIKSCPHWSSNTGPISPSMLSMYPIPYDSKLIAPSKPEIQKISHHILVFSLLNRISK